MRRFNTTGHCVPSEDYMVDISGKLEKIIKMIDNRQYFTMNRARQFGKTTTLALLEQSLRDRYIVISISFEGVGEGLFDSEERFCAVFKDLVGRALKFTSLGKEELDRWNAIQTFQLKELSESITSFCKQPKEVILFIDEVDKASNHNIFIHFLGMLRDKFLLRKSGKDKTFHSVVLAGVHDIKNIKWKLIKEGKYSRSEDEGSYNSPWNIAVDYDVDMSFCPDEIASMLNQYEADHNTGMDIPLISQEIYNYTGGYPYLVSRICQRVDEGWSQDWSLDGVLGAVKVILKEDNTLFDDLFKNLENSEELYHLIYDILIIGQQRTFSKGSPTIRLGSIFGIIKEADGKAVISNRIFEIIICNYFIAKDEEKRRNRQIAEVLQYDIVHNDRFDMELCLRKFAQHFREVFDYENQDDIRFLERHGRMVFLSYLKPLINGKGFYHIESQFTDLRRMDIVVDYGKEQFIIELKRWHGGKGHKDAYDQLLGYLESKSASVGYLVTFDFRKAVNKQPGAEWVEINGRRIFDIIV